MEHKEKEDPIIVDNVRQEKEDQTPRPINRYTSRMFSGAPFADRSQGRTYKVPDHIREQYKD